MRSAQRKASVLGEMRYSQSSYLLMVPNTVVAGDAIWALAGGQALYIFRSIDRGAKRYRFIGECYVHGLMDGEIIRRLRLRDAKMENLSLH